MGYFDAALMFFDYATRLEPSNENYAYLALEALARAGRMHDALERANAILREKSPSARHLFKAADVLFHAARTFRSAEAAVVYSRVLLVLERAFSLDASSQEALPSVTVGGLVLKGLCHEHLNHPDEAKQAYTAALAVDPEAEAALTARGLLLLDTDPTAALRNFERAVRKGTPLLWPYFYLAHDALQNSEYRRCLDLAERALARTQAPILRANLMGWKAIATAELAPGSRASIELMQDAQTFNPISDRIAANLQAVLAGKNARDLQVANDTSSRAAMKGFSGEVRLTG